ncbi:acyltransferase family protein [Enterobacillus tribolii]|uniref:Fucose 4-O-acetylase-like acetyltransferase n=1 Tax=Enterobacillus tribolii TaxID=1487935 RepID=A0A370R2M9_9GAMM|nr:acyltransferase family protein [Enterobacillus tribolii]MBW7984702.1 hypothetical protein [Enterobacillus tribolii]RDK96699.1 fucose 4-O-acetylase-like acetyltransferase [Enterobacillus tribolii]
MGRNYFIDNAKGLLIFFVVFGHLLERTLTWDSSVGKVLLSVIYSFHMPAFILLAGMTFSTKNIVDKIINVAVIFILFQLFHTIPMSLFYGVGKLMLFPYWTLWFLVSLVWWYIIVFFIEKCRFNLNVCITISVIMALLVHFSVRDISIFSFHRTIHFLPFFLIGYKLGRNWTPKYKISSLFFIFSVILVSIMFLYLHADKYILFGSYFFEISNGNILISIFFYFISAICVYTLIMIIPNKKTLLSDIGIGCMSVYLLHSFLIELGGQQMLNKLFSGYGDAVFLLVVIAFSLIITKVLSSHYIDGVIRMVSRGIVKNVVMTKWN